MSGTEDNGGRRPIVVEGDDEERPAIEYRPRGRRSAADALGLDRDPAAHEGVPVDDAGEPLLPYAPDRLRAFLAGGLTLGDLEGVGKEEQYQIAELGFTCLTSGKLDEAGKIFAGLLALDPFDAYFNLAVGSVAHQRGDFEQAELRYTRCLEINPHFATALAHRGEVRIVTGRLSDGTDDLVRAVELDPGAREPATHRARATLKVLHEKLGSLDREDLERRAEQERNELAETEEVVEAALAAARAAEAEPARGPEAGRPRKPARRGRPSAKKPKK
jgi:tetratricopeptide (TPR) repeat protein